MLDKKQIWMIFLLEFKMGHKAVKTTCNINNTYGPGTANDHSMVVWHLKQTGKEKSSISGCFMSWQQIKKIIIWKCHLLLFNATIINQIVMCNKKVTVRKHLTGGFLCAVLDLSWILCSLLTPQELRGEARLSTSPGAEESRHLLR